MVEDKIRYWDLVIDWAINNGKADQIQVVSECDDMGNQETTIIDPGQLQTHGHSPVEKNILSM